MITIKVSLLLKEKLRETETEIISAIQKELGRIGRCVDSRELDTFPLMPI